MRTPAWEQLAAKAAEHGWATQTISNDDCVVVWMLREGQGAFGLWESGRWRAGVVLQRADAGVLTRRDLEQVLASAPCDLEGLLDALGEALRTKRREQALAARARREAKA